MANEVMQSLFGLNSYDTAQSLRKQQMAEDLAYAQLDPKQQVIFSARQAGRTTASGLNQLFGLAPEPLQRVNKIEDAMREVQASGADLSNPEVFYPLLTKALSSRGLQQEALMVTAQGHTAVGDYVGKMAQMEAAQRQRAIGTADERGQLVANQVEDILASGVEPSKDQLRSGLKWLLDKVSNKTTYRIDDFGQQQPVIIEGNKQYLAIYPRLAALLSEEAATTKAETPTAPAPVAAPAPEAVEPTVPVPTPAADVATYPLPPQGVAPGTPLEAAPAPTPAAMPTPVAAPTPAAMPAPVAAPTPAAMPAPVAAPAPVVAPAPSTVPQVTSELPKKPVAPTTPATWDPQSTRNYNTAFEQYKVDMQSWLADVARVDKEKAENARRMHEKEVLAIQRSAEERQLRKEAAETEEKARARTNALTNTVTSTGTSLSLIKEAVEIIRRNPRMSTGWGSLIASAPNSDARALANKLKSIQGSVALQTMQQLKETSPTGTTGFGPMNIPELEITKNKFGTMDQADNAEMLLRDLKRVAEAMYTGKKVAAQELADAQAKKTKGK